MVDIPPRLEMPAHAERDHMRGCEDAEVTLVEYGDYTNNSIRSHRILEELHQRYGEHYCYVFRHFPSTPQARRVAEATEAAAAQGKFWEMHDCLNERAPKQVLDDTFLRACAENIGLDLARFDSDLSEQHYEDRVEDDLITGADSGVKGTPTFFINNVRYDGPWDLNSLAEAIERPLGIRFRQVFQRFMRIEASSGILLILSTILALVWINSSFGDSYIELWETHLELIAGDFELSESLLHWISDGLMVIFFFVVGLEIKREVLVGELSELRQAMLPLVGAIGGVLVPAAIYFAFNAGTPTSSGWGISIATDIAFLLGVMAIIGSRVPQSLKVTFTALAIADDIMAVLVIAIFYSADIQWIYLGGGAVVLLLLIALNRLHVHSSIAYLGPGIVLWYLFLESGVHPTIAGVLLAFTIPAQVTVNETAFLAQVNALLRNFESPERLEEASGEQELEAREQDLAQQLERIAERIESPLQYLERVLQPWATYLVIPLFILANTGIELRASLFSDALRSSISVGIFLGLVIGKPVGITAISWLVTRLGLAELPADVDWPQFFAASVLAGIGFTMSLFIAGTEFSSTTLELAKLGILAASIVAGVVGIVLLWLTSFDYRQQNDTT